MIAGRRFVAVALVVAATLLGTALAALSAIARGGPSTLDFDVNRRIALIAGGAIDQSFFMPACTPRALEISLARPTSSPGQVSLELYVADRRGWPEAMVFSASREVTAGATRLLFELPSLSDSWRRLFSFRLQVAAGPPVELETRRPPFGWRGQLKIGSAWRGGEAISFRVISDTARIKGVPSCVFDGRDASLAWLAIGGLLLVALTASAAAAFAAAAARRRPSRRVHARARLAWLLLPCAAAAVSGVTWMTVIPQFEGPDEVAHARYAHYVAVTGTLPSTLPPPGSPWADAYYEWVQPPVAYIAAAALLRSTGVASAVPQPRDNPLSMVHGGPERTLYRHGAQDATAAWRASRYLRLLNLTYTVLIVGLAVLLLRRHLHDTRIAVAAATALALVPQWSAALVMSGNDAPATLLATAAIVLIARVASGSGGPVTMAGAGLVAGLAVGTKLTTAFLVPTAIVACGSPALRGRRRDAGWLALGFLSACGWIYLRQWLLFGDPMAADFKRDILQRSGFTALSAAQPPVTDVAFWVNLHAQLYEAFWARFGSLGAGPGDGSRVWWLFAILSGLLVVTTAAGLVAMARRRPASDEPAEPDSWVGVILLTAFVSGVAFWLGANLANRPDTVVHWTPRHLLPLSAVALAIAGAGVRHLADGSGRWAPAWRLAGSTLLASLGAAWIVAWRHAVQQFHLGYL